MATSTKGTQTNVKQSKGSGVVQTVQRDVRPLRSFFTKFSNDWCMNFSGALAYSILMSMVPIVIAIFAILGFIVGTLAPGQLPNLIDNIKHVLPSVSADLIKQAQDQLHKNTSASVILAIIAIALALFSGSRLFIQIEGFFSIIYHVRQRTLLKQNLMAIGMLLIFIILIPIM